MKVLTENKKTETGYRSIVTFPSEKVELIYSIVESWDDIYDGDTECELGESTYSGYHELITDFAEEKTCSDFSEHLSKGLQEK